jgi:biopolymer transport protein TolR
MSSGGGSGMMAEINVTPLVDVMLVLLIIFMITAPMIEKKKTSQRKVGVDLPQTDGAPVDLEAEEKLILQIDKELKFFLADNLVADCGPEHASTGRTVECLKEFEVKLKGNRKLRSDRELYLEADRTIPYGVVVDVMARLKKSGVDQLGMITDPPDAVKGGAGKGKRKKGSK